MSFNTSLPPHQLMVANSEERRPVDSSYSIPYMPSEWRQRSETPLPCQEHVKSKHCKAILVQLPSPIALQCNGKKPLTGVAEAVLVGQHLSISVRRLTSHLFNKNSKKMEP